MPPFDDNDFSDHEGSPQVNLVPPLVGLLLIGVIVYAMSVIGVPLAQDDSDPAHCAPIADAPARLLCYDQTATPQAPAKGALAPLGMYGAREISK